MPFQNTDILEKKKKKTWKKRGDKQLDMVGKELQAAWRTSVNTLSRNILVMYKQQKVNESYSRRKKGEFFEDGKYAIENTTPLKKWIISNKR